MLLINSFMGTEKNGYYGAILFSDLSVHVPPYPLHHRPAQCALSNHLTPKEKRDPEDKHPSAYSGHFSICDRVPMFCYPGVGVKTEQEAESRLEC
jgi:hypothetical protein